MSDYKMDEIRKRLDCLVLLSCMNDSSEKEKMKVAASCLGIKEVANALGKDPSNFRKSLYDKWGKGKKKKENEGGRKE